ncbi:hypothetical protein SAMN05192583_2733 [Sphingomonas gellani]|uniref:Uncharacterized protein n=2 Tax=Sphingomonas gellani TaxID=1166340 RepID=A0A1H8G7B5_9SPHN|nr:hypothetical protein SAMN05192583_2733 [Sphingomonas gellani]
MSAAATWIWEDGIGETRAALIVDGCIVEAAIEPHGPALRVGAVVEARIAEAVPGGGAIVVADEIEALLDRIPPRTGTGRTIRVAVVRDAIPEAGRPKRAKVVASDAAVAPAPTLRDRIAASGIPARQLRAHEPDALEAAGWSELLAEALTGEIAFPGGALRLSPTPAMTLFDVDGAGPAEPLAIAGARAAVAAIRRMGIGGSVGIDLPTLAGKGPRAAVAAAIDAALPLPFERTAVNGFGFLQIVRPRPRASLPELLRSDPIAAEARALLRRLEREPLGSPTHHRVPPAVLRHLEPHPDWLELLARRTGVRHRLDTL